MAIPGGLLVYQITMPAGRNEINLNNTE